MATTETPRTPPRLLCTDSARGSSIPGFPGVSRRLNGRAIRPVPRGEYTGAPLGSNDLAVSRTVSLKKLPPLWSRGASG